MGTMNLGRRTLLGAAATAALTSLPGTALASGRSHHHPAGNTVRFTLGATTLDGGEQVTSVTLQTGHLHDVLHGVDPASLTTSTFTVHAKATSPVPVPAGGMIFSEYDVDRTVTAARFDRHGNIVLDLASPEGGTGGGTLGYLLPANRNVRMNLVYTITQKAPLRLRNGRTVSLTQFVQGALLNREVDAFSYHVSSTGMNYRLFTPAHTEHGRSHGHRHRRPNLRPLIVWLHGGGEGGMGGYYDNETTLRANRGALGFATAEAQRIFGGAYVVAPQCRSFWMENGPVFAPEVKTMIDELVAKHDIDPRRIHVVGCSNGGYMTMRMEATYHGMFASAVPICGVVQEWQRGTGRLLTDAELKAIETPTWLVASKDDTTVPPVANSVLASQLIPGAQLSLYDHVIWNGHQFPGHWSWIYVGRNDPRNASGQHVWQWMAAHHR